MACSLILLVPSPEITHLRGYTCITVRKEKISIYAARFPHLPFFVADMSALPYLEKMKREVVLLSPHMALLGKERKREGHIQEILPADIPLLPPDVPILYTEEKKALPPGHLYIPLYSDLIPPLFIEVISYLPPDDVLTLMLLSREVYTKLLNEKFWLTYLNEEEKKEFRASSEHLLIRFLVAYKRGKPKSSIRVALTRGKMESIPEEEAPELYSKIARLIGRYGTEEDIHALIAYTEKANTWIGQYTNVYEPIFVGMLEAKRYALVLQLTLYKEKIYAALRAGVRTQDLDFLEALISLPQWGEMGIHGPIDDETIIQYVDDLVPESFEGDENMKQWLINHDVLEGEKKHTENKHAESILRDAAQQYPLVHASLIAHASMRGDIPTLRQLLLTYRPFVMYPWDKDFPFHLAELAKDIPTFDIVMQHFHIPPKNMIEDIESLMRMTSYSSKLKRFIQHIRQKYSV